jgi:hypothetical protein
VKTLPILWAGGDDASCAILLVEGVVEHVFVGQAWVERPAHVFLPALLAPADVNSFLKASLEHFCSAPPATLAGATPPLLFLLVLHDPLHFARPVCLVLP